MAKIRVCSYICSPLDWAIITLVHSEYVETDIFSTSVSSPSHKLLNITYRLCEKYKRIITKFEETDKK